MPTTNILKQNIESQNHKVNMLLTACLCRIHEYISTREWQVNDRFQFG